MSEEREMLAGWLGQMIDDAETDGHRITINVAAAKRLRAALSGVPEGAASEYDVARAVRMLESLGWRVALPPSPVPSPEPLDVERLAQAMHPLLFEDLATVARPDNLTPTEWGRLVGDVHRRRWAALDEAGRIAREYARLAAPQPVPEPEDAT